MKSSLALLDKECESELNNSIGMELNKTVSMVVSNKKIKPQINNELINSVEKDQYFDSLITDNGKYVNEIKRKKQVCYRLNEHQ